MINRILKSLFTICFIMMFLLLVSCSSTSGSSGNYIKIYEKMDKQDWVNTDFGHYSILKTDDYILMDITWLDEHGVTQSVGFYWYGSSSSAFIDKYTFDGTRPICTWSITSKGLGPIQQYIENGTISFMNKDEENDSENTELLNLAIKIFDKRFMSKYNLSIA